MKSPRARRRRRIVFALLVCTIVGFFVAPASVKRRLVKRLPGLTHRQAALKRDDALRELMQHLAEAVQKFLLDTGKVTAERLFLVAPKPDGV